MPGTGQRSHSHTYFVLAFLSRSTLVCSNPKPLRSSHIPELGILPSAHTRSHREGIKSSLSRGSFPGETGAGNSTVFSVILTPQRLAGTGELSFISAYQVHTLPALSGIPVRACGTLYSHPHYLPHLFIPSSSLTISLLFSHKRAFVIYVLFIHSHKS